GRCGFPTCMAFAAAVINMGAQEDRCPYIEKKLCDADAKKHRQENIETALVKELKSRLKGINLAKRADGLGALVIQTDTDPILQLDYLGGEVTISAQGIFDKNGKELDPRDHILLYNYVFSGGNGMLSGKWIGLESFPNSISKVVTLRRYTEEKLAAAFEGDIAGLKAAANDLGAEPVLPCHADLCLVIPALPKVPIQIHFWDADREDGFEARVKVLFDSRALDFLDIESLVFISERVTETLIERRQKAIDVKIT
ncbi:MAG: DUF3786 domain-containing protein, partial [Dissulfurimicrobium sp.]